jgi:hypothetical protein
MIIDRCRDKEEFKEFFYKYPMDDGIYSLDFILNNPNLFCFYNEENGKLEAFISVCTDETQRLLLSGAGRRKNMQENINAVKMVCNIFDEDMYAETDKKPARILLLKAQFEKIDNNLYRRKING